MDVLKLNTEPIKRRQPSGHSHLHSILNLDVYSLYLLLYSEFSNKKLCIGIISNLALIFRLIFFFMCANSHWNYGIILNNKQ